MRQMLALKRSLSFVLKIVIGDFFFLLIFHCK